MSATQNRIRPQRPPRLPELFLRAFLPTGTVRDSVLGDLCEEYDDLAQSGRGRAPRGWYWRQALQMGGWYFWTRLRRPAAEGPARPAGQHDAGNGPADRQPSRISPIPSRRGWSAMADLLSDLRVSLRVLWKQPGFSLVTVVTLALAIGANTAIFSVVDGTLLQPLPLPEPETLVRVYHSAPGMDEARPDIGMTSATYFYFRDSDVLADLALFRYESANLSGGEAPERVLASHVTHSFFETLGVPTAMGRAFSAEDDEPGSPPVVLLSDAFWRSQFGGAMDIVGKTVQLDGATHEIIGVAPAGFEFPRRGTRLWVPMQLDREEADIGRFGAPSVARMKDGMSLEQTSARLAALLENLTETFPEQASAPGLERAGLTAAVKPLQEYYIGDTRQPLFILLGSVGFILLIACANVANLFLVRAESREREMAVRVALGAGRRRLVVGFLTEACVLGLTAGVVGLLFAFAGVRALVRYGPTSAYRLEEVGIDARVLLFTFVISLVAGVLFGAIPALRTKTSWLAAALKEGGRAQTSGRSRHRARNILVGAQVALAVVLLVGSGLMVRTYQTLTSVDLGYNPENVLTFRLMLPQGDYPGTEAPAAFVQQVIEKISTLPGVLSAGAVNHLPLGYTASGVDFTVEDRPLEPGDRAQMHIFKRSAPGFFETMQIPLRAGRTFERADHEENRGVAVISEAVAQLYWPGENPIGKRIQPGGSDTEGPDPALWHTIVGVVGNVRNLDLEEEDGEIVYLPMRPIDSQSGFAARVMGFVVRADGDPTALVDSIRASVQALDPDLPLANVLTMEGLVAWAREDEAFMMALLLIGALGALLIGSVGIYGVVSYVVSQRTHEIGVRMALGARTAEIGWMVLRRSLTVTVAGILAGVTASIALTSFMSTLLYGVSPLDPVTFVVVIGALVVVAALAAYLPARRAAKVDPLEALRFE